MSLLQQGSGIDDSARGEELTKGTSHIVIASAIAAVVVTIAIAAYFISGQKPVPYAGEVTRVDARFIHHESSGLDASGRPMPKDEFDQVLLFTHLKLHNQGKEPLFLRHFMTNITLESGVDTSFAASPTDYERLFKAYPDLAPLHGKSLSPDDSIPPGQWLEGDFIASFRMAKAQFEGRKGLDYAVSFRYLPDLKLSPPGPVQEQ